MEKLWIYKRDGRWIIENCWGDSIEEKSFFTACTLVGLAIDSYYEPANSLILNEYYQLLTPKDWR